MAGYDGFSKSNNAIAAEENGRYPLTRAVRVLAPALGITQAQARYLLEEQGTTEWHHTSKEFNATRYYDVESLLDEVKGGEITLTALLEGFRKKEKKVVVLDNCTVKWIEWAGTRRHPKAIKHEEKGCTVEDKGGEMVTITLPDGTSFRKGKSTNGFEVHKQNMYGGDPDVAHLFARFYFKES